MFLGKVRSCSIKCLMFLVVVKGLKDTVWTKTNTLTIRERGGARGSTFPLMRCHASGGMESPRRTRTLTCRLPWKLGSG